MNEQSLNFQLPSLLMSPADLSRVRRELSALDEYLRAQELRQPGIPMERLPKLSRGLDELAAANKLNLLHETERADLERFLGELADHAPVLHISFAADPSSASLQKLVLWLRQHISPVALVRVGLQPNIAAGCVLQTTNRYFDFSLKRYLREHRSYLLEAIKPPANTEAAP